MSIIGVTEHEYGITVERWGREVTITPEGDVEVFLPGPQHNFEAHLHADGTAWIDLLDGGAINVRADGEVERLTIEEVTKDVSSPAPTSSVQPDQEGLPEPRPAPPAERPDLETHHRHDTEEATA